MLSTTRPLTRTTDALLLLLVLLLSIQPISMAQTATPKNEQQKANENKRLKAGEVVVDCKEVNGTKFVVAKILIPESAEKIWPVVANPFEFRSHICRRMKKVDVLDDQPCMSLINCKIGTVFPLPDIDYVVESRYVACKRIDFRRIRGSLRDFRGFWELQSYDEDKTEVTYSMYVDPGLLVPDWIVRQGMRSELPAVLLGLRERMNSLRHCHGAPEKHTIAAAGLPHTL